MASERPGEPQPPAGNGYYGMAPEAEPDGPDIHRYLGVIVKRRWSALTALLVVLTLVVVYNYTAVPVYEATARVLVETDRLNLVDIEDVIDQRRALDAELAILQSRWLAERTVESLGLLAPAPADAGRPANAGPDDEARSASFWSGTWAAVATFAARAFGIGAAGDAAVDPSALDEGFPGESQAEARRVNAFLGGLTVSFTATASNVLDIRYRAADPVLAARFANTHAQEYINQNVDRRFAAIQEVTDWLADRLAEQRQKVDASEQALARFREENGLTTIEGSSPTVTRLNELTASLTRTQAERLEKEALYNKAQALRGDPDSLDRLPLMASDKALQERRLELDRLERHRTELAATLRERHPEMVKVRQDLQTARAMLDAERTRLLESLRQEVATLQGAEASLGRALDGLELEAVTQDRKGVQLSVLMREAESNRQIYDLLLQRARETGVAKDLNPSRTRVLDRALVPAAPVSPNRQRNILRGLFAGLALALMVAFGLERVDSRVKTPDEVSEHLGLPYIGLLPEVALEGGATRPLATNGIAPQFSEELRRIRTNVLFSFSGDAARSVVVTSASPGEGKTVLASNLAVALAQAKERVLLVDADLRRPALHEAFPVPQEPGLSNVLVGECKLTQAVHESAVRNLWILPAGRRPPNPSELLGSAEFRRLLAHLNERFTWILFDTPPVMAVTDACVLAHSVSGVVFVVGSEQVSRHLARRAVGQIAAAHGKLVGGVLNRVAVHRNKYYYSSYSAAYSKKYGGYYHQPPPAEAETESTPGRAHA